MKFEMSKIAKVAALGVAAAAGAASQADAALVINEVYGGGGNSGAPYNADFVELLNNGTASLTYSSGITIQYGSATGYYATNTFTLFTTPSITLLPGQTYLIGGAAATASTAPGVALSGVDFTTSLNMGATGGKIRILDGSTVLDLVGFGNAAASPTAAPTAGIIGPGFEGTAAAIAPSNSLSIVRTGGIDTDSNSADFVTATPTPTGSVPEPAAMGLAAAVGTLLIGRRRR